MAINISLIYGGGSANDTTRSRRKDRSQPMEPNMSSSNYGRHFVERPEIASKLVEVPDRPDQGPVLRYPI